MLDEAPLEDAIHIEVISKRKHTLGFGSSKVNHLSRTKTKNLDVTPYGARKKYLTSDSNNPRTRDPS